MESLTTFIMLKVDGCPMFRRNAVESRPFIVPDTTSPFNSSRTSPIEIDSCKHIKQSLHKHRNKLKAHDSQHYNLVYLHFQQQHHILLGQQSLLFLEQNWNKNELKSNGFIESCAEK